MNAQTLLIDGSQGIYIPQQFAAECNAWRGVDPDNVKVLAAGPDSEGYWEAWDEVLEDAFYMDGKDKYTLHQDGDLWGVCPERMSNEQYEEFFDGAMKPAPPDAYEYEVCGNCLIALANDDYSGMDDEEERETKRGLDALSEEYGMVIPDGAGFGFSWRPCECCDGLAGDRYRVVCFNLKT